MDKKTVKKLSKLAHIYLTPTETESMEKDITSILHWTEQLNEIKTQDIEPSNSLHINQLTFRTDKVSDGNIPKELTKNAPESQDNHFAVPKVVE